MRKVSFLSFDGIAAILWRGVVVLLVSAFLGLLVNAVSPKGVDIMGPVVRQGMSLDEAWTLFRTNGGVFVDARSQEEYDAGHIPGALLLSYDDFEESISSFQGLVPLDTVLVAYCSAVGCGSSAEVAELLREVGYSEVHQFPGGWEAWTKAKYPTAPDKSP